MPVSTRTRGWQLARTGGVHVLLGCAALALVVPMIATGTYVFTWTTAVIWALFAMATNVLFGWSGLLSFGQTAFFGLGGYTVALIHENRGNVDGLLLLAVAAVVAAVAGAAFSVIALRSTGAEFAVLTLVLAQVLWLLTNRVRALHGEDGIGGLYSITILGRELASDEQTWYTFVAIAAVCCWLLWMLHRSTLGAAMRAVRDDAHRAAALGIRVRRVQVLAFAIGSAFSAVAGGMLGLQQGVVSPTMLSLTISGQVLVACLVGGLRVFGGPVLGAVVLILAQQALSGVATDSTMFVGILLLVIVLVLPSGLTSLPGVLAAHLPALRRRARGPSPVTADPAPATAPKAGTETRS